MSGLNHEFILVTQEEVDKIFIRPYWRDYGVLNKDYVVIDDRYIFNQIQFQLGYNSYVIRGIGIENMVFRNTEEMVNYWGANLILNQDLDDYIEVMKKMKPKKVFSNLISLCYRAKKEKLHLVYFGV